MKTRIVFNVLVASILFVIGCSTAPQQACVTSAPVSAKTVPVPNEYNAVLIRNETNIPQTFVVSGEGHDVDPGTERLVYAHRPPRYGNEISGRYEFYIYGLPSIKTPTSRQEDLLVMRKIYDDLPYLTYVLIAR